MPTRFAPSPTGYLHIGGVRTALFNWLLAQKNEGQFVLRVDDTDEKRNLEDALQPILDGFRWLGIEWDEGPEVNGPYAPYFQSERLDRYVHAVTQLLEGGFAYREYSTAQEIPTEPEAAENGKYEILRNNTRGCQRPQCCCSAGHAYRLYPQAEMALE